MRRVYRPLFLLAFLLFSSVSLAQTLSLGAPLVVLGGPDQVTTPTPTPEPEEPLYQQLARAVVRIEEHQAICTPGRPTAIERDVLVGSGFFVQHRIRGVSQLFIVTARHVVNDQADLFARVQMGPKSQQVAILYLPRRLWVFDPTRTPDDLFPVDVAAMQIPSQPFVKAFLYCPASLIEDCGKNEKTGQLQRNQLVESPSVMERAIFFGFPVGDVGASSIEPFARAGVVAYTAPNPDLRIDNRRLLTDTIYLIGAPAFLGNSGGPVLREPQFLEPEIHLWGLITGSSGAGRDYAVATRPEKIRETIDHARSESTLNKGAWHTDPPHLNLKCE